MKPALLAARCGFIRLKITSVNTLASNPAVSRLIGGAAVINGAPQMLHGQNIEMARVVDALTRREGTHANARLIVRRNPQ